MPGCGCPSPPTTPPPAGPHPMPGPLVPLDAAVPGIDVPGVDPPNIDMPVVGRPVDPDPPSGAGPPPCSFKSLCPQVDGACCCKSEDADEGTRCCCCCCCECPCECAGEESGAPPLEPPPIESADLVSGGVGFVSGPGSGPGGEVPADTRNPWGDSAPLPPREPSQIHCPPGSSYREQVGWNAQGQPVGGCWPPPCPLPSGVIYPAGTQCVGEASAGWQYVESTVPTAPQDAAASVSQSGAPQGPARGGGFACPPGTVFMEQIGWNEQGQPVGGCYPPPCPRPAGVIYPPSMEGLCAPDAPAGWSPYSDSQATGPAPGGPGGGVGGGLFDDPREWVGRDPGAAIGTSKYPLSPPPRSDWPGAPDYLYITISNPEPCKRTEPPFTPEAPVGYSYTGVYAVARTRGLCGAGNADPVPTSFTMQYRIGEVRGAIGSPGLGGRPGGPGAAPMPVPVPPQDEEAAQGGAPDCWVQILPYACFGAACVVDRYSESSTACLVRYVTVDPLPRQVLSLAYRAHSARDAGTLIATHRFRVGTDQHELTEQPLGEQQFHCSLRAGEVRCLAVAELSHFVSGYSLGTPFPIGTTWLTPANIGSPIHWPYSHREVVSVRMTCHGAPNGSYEGNGRSGQCSDEIDVDIWDGNRVISAYQEIARQVGGYDPINRRSTAKRILIEFALIGADRLFKQYAEDVMSSAGPKFGHVGWAAGLSCFIAEETFAAMWGSAGGWFGSRHGDWGDFNSLPDLWIDWDHIFVLFELYGLHPISTGFARISESFGRAHLSLSLSRYLARPATPKVDDQCLAQMMMQYVYMISSTMENSVLSSARYWVGPIPLTRRLAMREGMMSYRRNLALSFIEGVERSGAPRRTLEALRREAISYVW